MSAEINFAQARYHHWTSLANPFADRRTDLFDALLGYREPADASKASLAEWSGEGQIVRSLT